MSKRKIEIDEATLRGLLDRGLTLSEAASELGVSESTVRRRAAALGIEPKPSAAGREDLPPIPERIGHEDRLKLEYIRQEVERGDRDARDEAMLRDRYREILPLAHPGTPRASHPSQNCAGGRRN